MSQRCQYQSRPACQGFKARPIMFSVRPTHCAATVIYLRSICGRPKGSAAPIPVRHRSCCRAIKTHATKRSIVFLCAKARPFESVFYRWARSIEASACLSFGTTGTTPWPRWRRLPLSSSLSWWLPALLRSRKVGGDERVRQKIDLGETSANRTCSGRAPPGDCALRIFSAVKAAVFRVDEPQSPPPAGVFAFPVLNTGQTSASMKVMVTTSSRLGEWRWGRNSASQNGSLRCAGRRDVCRS